MPVQEESKFPVGVKVMIMAVGIASCANRGSHCNDFVQFSICMALGCIRAQRSDGAGWGGVGWAGIRLLASLSPYLAHYSTKKASFG